MQNMEKKYVRIALFFCIFDKLENCKENSAHAQTVSKKDFPSFWI